MSAGGPKASTARICRWSGGCDRPPVPGRGSRLCDLHRIEARRSRRRRWQAKQRARAKELRQQQRTAGLVKQEPDARVSMAVRMMLGRV